MTEQAGDDYVTFLFAKTAHERLKIKALPTEAKARKAVPLATGCVDYFPAALAAVAELSRVGNEQHNPGKPLHWDRSKSTDEADCLMRHFIERGAIDSDGVRHSTKVAWRALALLQKEIGAAKKDAGVPAEPPRKMLPNGYYVGQHVFYERLDGNHRCQRVYGTVVCVSTDCDRYGRNYGDVVWAWWDNSVALTYMPANRVRPV